jgi:hypothetical protein
VWDNAIFPSPVRRAGYGSLLLSTDCVRLRKSQFFTLFFGFVGSQFGLGSHCGVGWELRRVGTSRIILDLYHVTCLIQWSMGRIGKVGREVVKKLDYQW